MSNPYPPTPSLGGAYTGYPFASMGSRDGYQTLAGGPPVPQHGDIYSVTAPVASTTAANHQSFQANATLSNTASNTAATAPPPPPPLLPPPFPVSPDFFKQFANSTLPPPPYPPVPIPHLGFAQFPLPPPNLATTSTSPNNLVTNSSLPHQNNQPLRLSSPHAAPKYLQGPFLVPKEEGELSDGESVGSSPNSLVDPSRPVQTDQTASSVKTQEEILHHTQAHTPVQPIVPVADSISPNLEGIALGQAPVESGVARSANKMGNVFQRYGENQEDRAPSAENESVSSYNPPSALTPDPGEQSMVDPDILPGMPQLRNHSVPNKTTERSSATLSLHEQAKDALRSLRSYKIEYEQLVGEGVDPYLLRKLYEDLKQDAAQRTLPSPDMHVQPAPTGQDPSHREIRKANDPSGHLSHDAVQMPNTLIADTNLVLAREQSTSRITRSTQDPPNTYPFGNRGPTEDMSEKPPVDPPLSNRAMERKDRIAQLLAAKTGKALPPRPPSANLPQSPKKIANPETPANVDTKPLSLPAKPPVPSPEQVAKGKNKAQTELIRQKMEALKKEALAKTQAQENAKATSVVSSPATNPPSNAAFSQLPGGKSENGSDGSGFHIPGLFMTSEPRPHEPSTQNGSTEDSLMAMGKFDDQITLSSTSDSISQRTSVERDNDLAKPPGEQTLPTRLPQKRPLASASFEEQMPALKRPFGRKDSHDKVEIVVSEAESEGEVEDVEMELDEESEDETHNDRGEIAPMSLREKSIRNLPPLTDLPSPRPFAPSASRIATPASAAIATPGRENDKEELWRAKHQEIELMRKKIAEMEERRKAKQNATRAVSPKIAAKAALPVIRTLLTRPSNAVSLGLPTPLINASISVSPEPPMSPNLPASRPEELASTPSTPLHPLKEPLKGEDLRQKLLRKNMRTGTPTSTEMEMRQAQLAEKKSKLAELRREAEKREAEILEETRMLEAQLQAGLDEQQSYQDSCAEERWSTTDPDSSNGSLLVNLSEQGAGAEELAGAMPNSPGSQPETLPLKFPPQGPSLQAKIGLVESTTGSVLQEKNGVVDMMSPVAADGGATSNDPGEVDVETGAQAGERASLALPDNEASILVDEVGLSDVSGTPSFNGGNLAIVPTKTLDPDFMDDDGSVSMSDSASEDYEPAEPEQMEEDQADDDSEPYEPAEVSVTVDEGLSFTSRQKAVDEPIGPDLAVFETLPQPISQVNQQSDQPTYTNDSEDGVELTEPVVNGPQAISQSHNDETSDEIHQPVTYFTPYETPVKYFKNFRYHDHYPEIVPGGYKSLTFSNTIDPRKPFCPTELAGQACQDQNCVEQHFREVTLTDDKILAQMSTANDLKTKSEHEHWVAGLRQVIAELRSKGVKDFQMVASALAAYRRRFSEELSTSTSASLHS